MPQICDEVHEVLDAKAMAVIACEEGDLEKHVLHGVHYANAAGVAVLLVPNWDTDR